MRERETTRRKQKGSCAQP